MKNKILTFLLISFLFPYLAQADGVIITKLPDGDSSLFNANAQDAFINYENKIEKLVISIDTEKENFDSIWIIPIPAEPEKIKIDIIPEVPVFWGDSLEGKFKESISQFSNQIFLVQLLPLTFLSIIYPGAPNTAENKNSEVSSFLFLQKEGINAELLKVKDSQSFYDYFNKKGVKINPNLLPKLDFYIQSNYSFIVTWISNIEAERQTQKGIFVSFPTEKIYYPLILTSAYNEEVVSITLRILGYVKPKIPTALKKHTSVEYFTEKTKQSSYRDYRCKNYLLTISRILEEYYKDNKKYPQTIIISDRLTEDYNEINYALYLGMYNSMLQEECGICFYKSTGDSYKLIVIEKGGYLVLTPFQLEEYQKSYFNENSLYEVKTYAISYFEDKNDKYEKLLPLFQNEIQREPFTKEDFVSPELNEFYENKEPWLGNFPYTKIYIQAPAKLFTEDLWIENKMPLKISFLLFILNAISQTKLTLFSYLFIVGILSFLIGGLSGYICYKKFLKYALIGLLNIFTISCLLLGYFLFKNYNGIDKKRWKYCNFIILFIFFFSISLFLFFKVLYFVFFGIR